MPEGDDVSAVIDGGATDVGIYTATVTGFSGTDSGNYKVPTEVSHIFVINKAKIDLEVSIADWTYGDNVTPEPVVKPVGVTAKIEYKPYGAKSKEYSTTKPTTPGTYNIRATVAATAETDETSVEDSFTINAKTVTLTWDSQTEFAYTGSDLAPTVEVTGVVGTDEVNADVIGAASSVGTHTARVIGLTGAKAGYYKLPDNTTKNYTIVKADPSEATTPQ